MEFLLETPSVGYTPAELADQTEIPRGSVGPTLKRLEEAGSSTQKPYWAAAEDDRLGSAIASFVGVETAASSFGDDWYAENEGWEEDLPDLSAEDE